MATNLKTCTTRDSATAALRKLGVDKSRYNQFINVTENNKVKTFIVDLAAAEKSVSHIPIPVEPPVLKVPTKKAPKATQPESPKIEELKVAPKESKKAVDKPERRGTHDRGRTVSSVARELILQGLDNNAVYGKLVDEFKLDETKKYYPAWYRSELRKKGHRV